jgi:hypothetical protein
VRQEVQQELVLAQMLARRAPPPIHISVFNGLALVVVAREVRDRDALFSLWKIWEWLCLNMASVSREVNSIDNLILPSLKGDVRMTKNFRFFPFSKALIQALNGTSLWWKKDGNYFISLYCFMGMGWRFGRGYLLALTWFCKAHLLFIYSLGGILRVCSFKVSNIVHNITPAT